jgi:hypothetical protein
LSLFFGLSLDPDKGHGDPKSIPLQQHPEGILSVGEKNFQGCPTWSKQPKRDLTKKEELHRLFIAALRSSGILPPGRLAQTLPVAFLLPSQKKKLLQEAKWFGQGTCLSNSWCRARKIGKKAESDCGIIVEFEPEGYSLRGRQWIPSG